MMIKTGLCKIPMPSGFFGWMPTTLVKKKERKERGQNGTTIFTILDNTTELWMTKYIIGEFFSSGGGTTFYKNPSDQTVYNF